MPDIVVGGVDGLHHLDGSVELAGHQVRGVSWDGHGCWVLADRTVWHGRPGEEWEPAVKIDTFEPRCLLATGSEVLVGTAGAHLLRCGDGQAEVVASFDSAPGRDRWYTPWGGPADTRSMAVAPEGTLYVSVHVGGILRSDDDGASWQPTVDIDTDVHEVGIERGGERVVAATGAAGFLVSPDGGRTWEQHNEGLHATYLRAVTCTRNSLLVSAATGPHGGQAAVYRRALGSDEPFERCHSGLPDWFDGNVDTGCLAGSEHLAALAAPDGTVYRSDDGGRSWQVVLTGIAGPACAAVLP